MVDRARHLPQCFISIFYKERRQLVIALKSQGIETDEIASLAGITSRRVNQILADHRKETDARQVEDSSGM